MSLVITRKAGNAIWIGDTCVTIHEIRGKQVRLSIDADKSINIVRGELVDGKSTNKPYVRRKKEDRVGLSS